jgi:hypothetical protein
MFGVKETIKRISSLLKNNSMKNKIDSKTTNRFLNFNTLSICLKNG